VFSASAVDKTFGFAKAGVQLRGTRARARRAHFCTGAALSTRAPTAGFATQSLEQAPGPVTPKEL
jgi:hypothetical protein